METCINPSLLKNKLSFLGFDDYIFAENQGFVGGIDMGWKSDILQLTLLQKHFQFLHVSIKSGDESSWSLTAVYASPEPDGKKALWQELMKLTAKTDTGWLLDGDFNDIKDKSEKHGGIPPSDKKCVLFHERLNDCKLIDLGAFGHKFTWREAIDHGGNRVFERLDKVICSDNWRLQFPDAFVRVLTRIDFSDHHPILAHLYEDQRKPLVKDFKF